MIESIDLAKASLDTGSEWVEQYFRQENKSILRTLKSNHLIIGVKNESE